MSNHKWTKEEDRFIFEKVREGMKLSEIQQKYFPNRTYGSVRGRYWNLKKANGEVTSKTNPVPNNDEYQWKKQGDSVECSFVVSDPLKTEEELFEACGIDPNKWRVEKFECTAWTTPMSHLVDEDGEGGIVQNYKVSATLKKQHASQNFEQIKEDMIEAICQYTPDHNVPVNPRGDGDILFEVSPFDLHLGKYGYDGKDTHGEYNSDIAEQRLKTAADELTERATKAFDISRILLPIGQDFFHVDNWQNSTTNGTVQDTDSQWQESFLRGREIMVDVIDRLNEVAPVDIIVVPGNHDRQRAFYLGEALYCWYRNVPYVNVNNHPDLRKYYKWGINLLGFTHGNNEKHQSLPITMSNECDKWWSETKVREWHIGHIHQKKETKYNSGDTFDGITVRTLPSLAGVDPWHYRMGYVNNVKACEAFIWDANKGRVASLESMVR